jgi:1-acyl-sn-glycerol-3-phosphate acyltransferase
MRKSVRFIMLVWARTSLFILTKRIRIIGRENIVKGKNYLLLANHGSPFDIPAIMSFFPGVAWFGREHLLKIPLFGQILKMSNFIPMKKAGVSQTRHMLEQLIKNSDGLTIAIFPEGTRTLTGNFNKFHKGFIHVLRASDLDVLPVTLNGFYQLKPKNRFYISFESRVSATIHTPIPNSVLASLPDEEIIDKVRETLLSSYRK